VQTLKGVILGAHRTKIKHDFLCQAWTMDVVHAFFLPMFSTWGLFFRPIRVEE